MAGFARRQIELGGICEMAVSTRGRNLRDGGIRVMVKFARWQIIHGKVCQMAHYRDHGIREVSISRDSAFHEMPICMTVLQARSHTQPCEICDGEICETA